MSSVGLLHPQIDVDYDETIKERIADGQYQPQFLPPKPLSAMDTISDVWPESPPKKHLHVFIRLPTGKRPRSSSSAEEEANLPIVGEAERAKVDGEFMLFIELILC
jgi:hypothetical protein